jgi:hypothetical protein
VTVDVFRSICFCQSRIEAMQTGTFKYCHTAKAWYFTNAPTRSMSTRTAYYVYTERQDTGHENHSGEPYLHRDCTWCGHSLPGVEPDDTQSDGFR